MGRYFLNVRNGETLARDPMPYLFSTAQAAHDSAVQAVRDLLGADPEIEDLEQKRIEIADETGHPIAFVDLRDVRSANPRLNGWAAGWLVT